jgi:hypothetical protein
MNTKLHLMIQAKRMLSDSCICFMTILVLISVISCNSGEGERKDQHTLITKPDFGFVSRLKATKWEEYLVTGNGTLGAMVAGDPLSERIILSHEKLFMPEFPPTEAPDLGNNLEKIRGLVLDGKGREAAELALELGVEAGIHSFIWTDPPVPACQLEIESSGMGDVLDYERGVNYETGEAIMAWKTENGLFERKVFVSRPDQLWVMEMQSEGSALPDLRMRLATLPMDDEARDENHHEFFGGQLIEDIQASAAKNGLLTYTTLFKKQWDGSLKGFLVEAMVRPEGGSMKQKEEWLHIQDATKVTVVARIKLSWELPLPLETGVDQLGKRNYASLLKKHEAIHSEMFKRFSIRLGKGQDACYAEELRESSSVGNLNNQLVNQLCDAARYMLISSTGELPPFMQGIWGGTWRPPWSGDFIINGNAPAAIASGLNTNFREVIESYSEYMYSMFDEFRDNARDLYGAPGIFVPSRTGSSGKTYHFAEPYPHLYWYAGGAWSSQFFFDYWQYTGDEDFLRERAIPFMLACAEFYKYILVKDEQGKYHFIPSYSPEIGPLGFHPVAINATMDVAALKQLIRNLFVLEESGYLSLPDGATWREILENLPSYEVDAHGDLKEWLWPGLENDNIHRHASHLYPLFYEVDPEFKDRPELQAAASQAIENRLQYRRPRDGAEMAFGLMQKGLAAAHIGDTEHAYECVSWLCNRYWSTAFTSYHDPTEVFNVDIAGGLPAVVAEMLIQSSREQLILLPALPEQWSEGSLTGVGTRCGVTLDLLWEKGQAVSAKMTAHTDAAFTIRFRDQSWEIELENGESHQWNYTD